MYCPSDFTPFPWMKYALQEYGVREVTGTGCNASIAAYFTTVGLGPDDETSWCSAFANWCMKQAGIKGTGRATARSWLHWGNLSLGIPCYGAVTVLWRGKPNSWQGHVAFYVGTQGKKLLLLGGNQGNA